LSPPEERGADRDPEYPEAAERNRDSDIPSEPVAGRHADKRREEHPGEAVQEERPEPDRRHPREEADPVEVHNRQHARPKHHPAAERIDQVVESRRRLPPDEPRKMPPPKNAAHIKRRD